MSGVAHCPNCGDPYRAGLSACPECQYVTPVQRRTRKPWNPPTVPISLEARRPHDRGRCGVLVVKRFGRVLKTHTRSWATQAQEANARRNDLIDELLLLGPEHPNYLPVLAQIREMEARRIQLREEEL